MSKLDRDFTTQTKGHGELQTTADHDQDGPQATLQEQSRAEGKPVLHKELPKIDRKHSAPFNPNHWTEAPKIVALVERLYEELGIDDLDKTGNRKPKRSAKDMLRILLVDLVNKWLTDPTLSTGFPKNKGSYKVNSRYNVAHVSEKIIQIVQRLVKFGYLDEVQGHHDKTGAGQSYTSRIRPSLKLRAAFELLDADTYDIEHNKHAELIILREKYSDDEGEDRSRSIEYTDTELTEKWREQLLAYNALLGETFIDIPTLNEPFIKTTIKEGKRKGQEFIVSIGSNNKRVHRVFNGTEADTFTKGGRFYGGWWLQVPREYRKQIYLNDKPTVEVDYKAIHPNLLLGEPTYDPYDLGEIVLPTIFNNKDDQRSVVKGVVLMAINASSEDEAFLAFRTSREDGDIGKRLTNKQLQKLLDAFTDKYPEMKEHLNTGAGLLLMNKDSQIANMVIDHYTKQGIPVLCVHDSFIIEWNKEEDLKRVMHDAAVQVSGKGIANDSKRDETVVKSRVWPNYPLKKGMRQIEVRIPKHIKRTHEYTERLKKHQEIVSNL